MHNTEFEQLVVRDAPTRRAIVAVALAMSCLFSAVALQAHDPVPFVPTTFDGTIGGDCPIPSGPFAGQHVNCWEPVIGVNAGVEAPVSDICNSCNGGPSDDSGNTPPLDHLDLFNGENADLTTVFYAYSPELDMFFFRMRLLETPVRGTTGGNPDFPAGFDARGPFFANSAWNFVLDIDGNGWSDYLSQVDGNGGTNQDPNDNFRLAFNTDTTTQQVADDSDCLAGGQVLEEHKSNVIADVAAVGATPLSGNTCSFANIDIDGDGISEGDEDGGGLLTVDDAVICTFGGFPSPYDTTTLSFEGFLVTHGGGSADLDLQVGGCKDTDPAGGDDRPDLDVLCDFAYVRITNNVESTCDPAVDSDCDNDFFLDMQMPVSWFDTCETSDADADGIGGSQFMTGDTPFILCATTSVQPNDFVQKDLAFNGSFNMSKTTELPCSGPCTLNDGCEGTPRLLDTVIGCTGSTSPITLEAQILDALDSTDGTTVDDTQVDVMFYYKLASAPAFDPWIAVIASAPTTNPVLAPTGFLNEWAVDWDTSLLADDTYLIRVVISDDQGNIWDSSPVSLDTGTCSEATNPVTLASFKASRKGDQIDFQWSTETEVGNVGFDLFERTATGWRQINDELIVSKVIDSVDPQLYSFSASGLSSGPFAVQDVDISGNRKLHGGFSLDREYGQRASRRPIDWGAISHRRDLKGRGPINTAQASVTPRSAAQLRVEAAGLYRVSYEDLLGAGVDLTGVNHHQLALSTGGEPIPFRVEGRRGFGPGSFLEFFGRGLSTLYGNTNVYTLESSAKNALRTPRDNSPLDNGSVAPDSYMHTSSVERNRSYSFGAPTGDPWFDTQMLAFADQPQQFLFDFPVEGYVEGAAPASLTVSMWGVTAWPDRPDHHVVVSLNGTAISDQLFDGLADHTVTVELPPGLLQEGNNVLALGMPGDTGVRFDLVFYDHVTVTYPRSFSAIDGALQFTAVGDAFEVFDLPSPDVVVYRLGSAAGPTRINRVEISDEGGSFAARFPGADTAETYAVSAVGSLRTAEIVAAPALTDITSGSAQYLVISHGSFIDGLGPLVALRESGGLQVKVVDVEDVYAQFGFGRFDPDGIRNYIRHAVANMGTESVLLVGGDSYDYHDYLGLGSVSFIPSLYAATGSIVRFSPSDALMADVDGDNVPNVAIGRFPVRTLAELDAVIDKTLAYSKKSYGRTAIFAADSFDSNNNVSFSQNSDQAIGLLPGGWAVDRAYLDNLGVAVARTQLLASLNSGVALANFVGHSGPSVWTFSGLLRASDVSALTNSGRPAVVNQAGCWNTYYASPTTEALGTSLILAADRGAAAVIGSSTLTSAEADQALGGFFTPLLAARGVSVGEALLRAKQQLAVHEPDLLEALLGANLLGDPALVVDP